MDKFISTGILLCVLYVATCEVGVQIRQLNRTKRYIISIDKRNTRLRNDFIDAKFGGDERISQNIVIDGMNHLNGNLSKLDDHNNDRSNILNNTTELYILHYNVLQTFNRCFHELVKELKGSLYELADFIHYDIVTASRHMRHLIETTNMTVSDTHPPVRLSRSVHNNSCVGECIHDQLLYIIDKLADYIPKAKDNLWTITEMLDDDV